MRIRAALTHDLDPAVPLVRSLSQLGAVRLRLASDAQEERLCNDALERHHPLGYKKPFGYWARYFIESGEHGLGCMLLSGAARALGARERWIGWTDRQRLANLPWVVNNAQFLILPWIRVPHLASKLLGLVARALAGHWQARYGYPVLLREAFVEAERFSATCYQAANWQCVGETQGRGKLGDHRLGQVPVKTVWVYPLASNARAVMPLDPNQSESQPAPEQIEAAEVPDKPPPPGHGRLGAADYPGAKIEFCAHDDLAPGDQCRACRRGKLYPIPPLVRLRFTGQPLVAVTRYDLERLRCNACGGLFVAHPPPGATTERYDISLKV